MTFTQLGLPARLVATLEKTGFGTPKPIQEQAIPMQLEGRDILGIAQTGSGKTAAFGLPILAKLMEEGGRPEPKKTRALILAPTRELAVQIEETLRSFAVGLRISTVLVLGGVSRRAQVNKLARGTDIVVATPGRLKDLLNEGCLKLDKTTLVVLDEADRMLDMGFIKDVRYIMSGTARNRRTALFSATMAPEVSELARGLLTDPVRVDVAPQGTTLAEISQELIPTNTAAKRGRLSGFLSDEALSRVIVFTRTKRSADRVAKNLTTDGFNAAAIHGNKSQNARQAALRGFREGNVRILVATDIAARGIDVPGVSHVINYELPDEADSYVHRIGRTGRNGATGTALTLYDSSERLKLKAIEKLIRKAIPVTGDMSDFDDNLPIEKAPARKPRSSRGGTSHRGRRPTGERPAGEQSTQNASNRNQSKSSQMPDRRNEGGAFAPEAPGTAKPARVKKPRWSSKDKSNRAKHRQFNGASANQSRPAAS